MSDAVLQHHGAQLGINVVHGLDGLPTKLFSNLPIFATDGAPGALLQRVDELLAARKADPRASDALEQLTTLNDAYVTRAAPTSPQTRLEE